MKNLLLIAAGGSLGAVSRYIVSKKINLLIYGISAAGTLFVNFTGSFFIGFLFALSNRAITSSGYKAFFMIGFLGAYTTFSTYSLETINFFVEGQIKTGIINILLNNFMSLIMVISGILAFRFILTIIK